MNQDEGNDDNPEIQERVPLLSQHQQQIGPVDSRVQHDEQCQSSLLWFSYSLAFEFWGSFLILILSQMLYQMISNNRISPFFTLDLGLLGLSRYALLEGIPSFISRDAPDMTNTMLWKRFICIPLQCSFITSIYVAIRTSILFPTDPSDLSLVGLTCIGFLSLSFAWIELISYGNAIYNMKYVFIGHDMHLITCLDEENPRTTNDVTDNHANARSVWHRVLFNVRSSIQRDITLSALCLTDCIGSLAIQIISDITTVNTILPYWKLVDLTMLGLLRSFLQIVMPVKNVSTHLPIHISMASSAYVVIRILLSPKVQLFSLTSSLHIFWLLLCWAEAFWYAKVHLLFLCQTHSLSLEPAPDIEPTTSIAQDLDEPSAVVNTSTSIVINEVIQIHDPFHSLHDVVAEMWRGDVALPTLAHLGVDAFDQMLLQLHILSKQSLSAFSKLLDKEWSALEARIAILENADEDEVTRSKFMNLNILAQTLHGFFLSLSRSTSLRGMIYVQNAHSQLINHANIVCHPVELVFAITKKCLERIAPFYKHLTIDKVPKSHGTSIIVPFELVTLLDEGSCYAGLGYMLLLLMIAKQSPPFVESTYEDTSQIQDFILTNSQRFKGIPMGLIHEAAFRLGPCRLWQIATPSSPFVYLYQTCFLSPSLENFQSFADESKRILSVQDAHSRSAEANELDLILMQDKVELVLGIGQKLDAVSLDDDLEDTIEDRLDVFSKELLISWQYLSWLFGAMKTPHSQKASLHENVLIWGFYHYFYSNFITLAVCTSGEKQASHDVSKTFQSWLDLLDECISRVDEHGFPIANHMARFLKVHIAMCRIGSFFDPQSNDDLIQESRFLAQELDELVASLANEDAHQPIIEKPNIPRTWKYRILFERVRFHKLMHHLKIDHSLASVLAPSACIDALKEIIQGLERSDPDLNRMCELAIDIIHPELIDT